MISAAIREAALPERCKAHGLRKAAARRLAEAGCSASEIASITGHKTLAEVERYTRAADQEHLARQAIQRQSTNPSGKPLADEVANTTDEALNINSLCGMWRSLGETKGNSRKADKMGTNQLGCLPIATTSCYDRASRDC